MTLASAYLSPTAAGDLTEFATQYPASGEHWDKVDDDPFVAHDFDATYVGDVSSGSNKEDLYNLGSLPVGVGAISYIRVYCIVKANNSSITRTANISIKTGGTIYYGTSFYPNSAYNTETETWTTNPQTGLAWTIAEVNALQAGMRINGSVIIPVLTWSVTQIYVLVVFTLLEGLVGTVWQETTKLHWIDENGAEQSKEGTYVTTPGNKAFLWWETFLGFYLRYIDETNTDERRLPGTLTGVVGQPKGTIWVEGADLHGIDEGGDEVYTEGA